jgi:regulator of sigma E protease
MLCAIPLGGYVNLVGGEGNEEEAVPPELEERSFTSKPVWVKMAVIAAGSAGNLVFAVLAFWFVFLGGVPMHSPKIGQVLADSPAARAGLLQGDTVVQIDGRQIENWDELAALIRAGSPDAPLVFTVVRDSSEITVSVTPEIKEGHTIFGEKVLEPKVGIASGSEIIYRKTNVLSAGWQALRETGRLIYLTGLTVVKLVTRVLPSNTLGGPILIAEMAGNTARQGAPTFIYFLGLLSVNLGVLNLLPIPILDGGHIVLFAIEAAMGRSISLRIRELVQRAGLVLILMLTALVFYNDIVRLLSR